MLCCHSATDGGFIHHQSRNISTAIITPGWEWIVAHTKREMGMDAKLYVGNLSYNTTEESLRAAFAKAGTVVSVEMIKDRDTGRMKGFAFVTMSNQAEAENAIKLLNEKMVDNRAIRVNIARPREERPKRKSYNDRW